MLSVLREGVPKFPGKQREKPLFTASDFFEKSGENLKRLPTSSIIVFSGKLYAELAKRLSLSDTEFPYGGTFTEGINAEKDVIVVRIYPGSPLAAATVEELSSLGVKRILLLGTAGAINPNASFNDLVLCSKALRDEGTSYHYTKRGKYSYPSIPLTRGIGEKLSTAGLSYLKGGTWTTDAPYRETRSEIEHYAGLGILTVEMEASAVFTVAAARGVSSAAVFSISDELYRKEWTGIRTPEKGFGKLAEAASLFTEKQENVGGEI